MTYHLMNDLGHGWDHEDGCPNGGSYLGHTTELGHARMLARLEDAKLREAGKPGEVIVYTLNQYGAYQLIDWRAGVEAVAGELAAVA